MLSEKSQRTQNGIMFVDLDSPLNASRRLSALAELLVTYIVTGMGFERSCWQILFAVGSTTTLQ